MSKSPKDANQTMQNSETYSNNIKKSNKDEAMENSFNVKIIPRNISF